MPAPGRYAEWSKSDQAKGLRAVNAAIRRGELKPIKQMWRRHCTRQAQVYHHYAGYAPENLLKVIALCYKCHSAEHKRVGNYAGSLIGNEEEAITMLSRGKSMGKVAAYYRATVTETRKVIQAHLQMRLKFWLDR